MSKLIIKNNVNIGICDIIIVLINSTDPLIYLHEVEQVVPDDAKYRIIIDELLHIGNNNERFIYLEVENKKVIKSSMRFIIIPKQHPIRMFSRDILLFYDLVDCSILTPVQKKLLKKGIAI